MTCELHKKQKYTCHEAIINLEMAYKLIEDFEHVRSFPEAHQQ